MPWSSWCYVPRELVTHTLLGDETGPDSSPRPITLSQLATTTALAAWRMGKPLYRYDPTLYDALRQTPLTDVVLPAEVFTRLPHWGVYIETPDLTIRLPSMGDVRTGSVNVVGMFAALDDAPQRSTMFGRTIARRPPRLIIVLDVEEQDGDRGSVRAPVPIQLTLDRDVCDGLTDGWAAAIGEVYAPYLRQHPEESERAMREARRVAHSLTDEIAPLLTLILYLCSEQPDLMGVMPPPDGVTAGGPSAKMIAAHNITEWMVGSRIGAALRAGAPQDGRSVLIALGITLSCGRICVARTGTRFGLGRAMSRRIECRVSSGCRRSLSRLPGTTCRDCQLIRTQSNCGNRQTINPEGRH